MWCLRQRWRRRRASRGVRLCPRGGQGTSSRTIGVVVRQRPERRLCASLKLPPQRCPFSLDQPSLAGTPTQSRGLRGNCRGRHSHALLFLLGIRELPRSLRDERLDASTQIFRDRIKTGRLNAPEQLARQWRRRWQHFGEGPSLPTAAVAIAEGFTARASQEEGLPPMTQGRSKPDEVLLCWPRERLQILEAAPHFAVLRDLVPPSSAQGLVHGVCVASVHVLDLLPRLRAGEDWARGGLGTATSLVDEFTAVWLHNSRHRCFTLHSLDALPQETTPPASFLKLLAHAALHHDLCAQPRYCLRGIDKLPGNAERLALSFFSPLAARRQTRRNSDLGAMLHGCEQAHLRKLGADACAISFVLAIFDGAACLLPAQLRFQVLGMLSAALRLQCASP
mmetsp:Transcript_113671/g.321432  ORF Transcript_113671/g.321432 Transcript_113671/m.321432 type:complete len:394 (-) Transcript_113671:357-1538(-)